MADSTKTVEIIFDGVDKLSDSVKKIDKAVAGIGDAAEPLADVANGVVGVQAALVGLAAAGAQTAIEIRGTANQLAAALGIPIDEAQNLQKEVETLYSSGFTESIEQSTDIITDAFRRFGDEGTEAVQSVAQGAAVLNQTFGTDTEQIFGSLSTLTREFGISTSEALDLLTKGLQTIPADDLLESITEYSTQFGNAGASADQFFSLLSSGVADGVLGTDKAADAFKEFTLRIADGSKSTSEGLSAIGLSADQIQKDISSGNLSIADAFTLVQKKLSETEDPVEQFNAGVALFGTQFEDLGRESALALTLTNDGFKDVAGSLDKVKKDSDTFSKSFTSLFRTLRVEIANLPIWDDFFSEGKDTVKKIAELLPDAFDNVDFSGLLDAFKDLEGAAGGVFEELFDGIDITTPEGLAEVIQTIVDAVGNFTRVSAGIIDTWKPVVGVIGDAIRAFSELDDESVDLIGNILGIAQQVAIFAGAFGAGSAVLSTFGGAVSGVGTAVKTLAPVLGSVTSALTGPAGLIAGAAAAGAAIGTLIRQIPGVDEATQDAIGALDAFFGFSDAPTKKELEETEKAYAATVEKIKAAQKAKEDLNAVPNPEPVDVEVDDSKAKDAGITLEEFNKKLKEAQEKGLEPVQIKADSKSISEAQKQIDALTADQVDKIIKVGLDDQEARGELESFEVFVDGKVRTFYFPVETEGIDKAKKDLDELPTEKQVEVAIEVGKAALEQELAIIEVQAKTVQDSLKYKAEVDIAEAQAAAQVLEASFDSINTGIESTGSLIASLIGGLGDADFNTRTTIEAQLRLENEYREKQFELQERLTNEQIALLEARREKLTSGDALINIDGSNLEPEFSLLCDAFVRTVQIKTTEEGLELLGLAI